MAETNGDLITQTFATLTQIEERVQLIEAKVAQAEAAYFKFIRESQDNPIMRMALGKFGLIPDDSSNG